jgi:hypothetical protein
MTDQPTNPASVQLVGALFDRLGSQLTAQAASEQANQTELEALKEKVTDLDRTKLLDAGIAHQATRVQHAGELAETIESRRMSVLTDLAGLMAVAMRPVGGPEPPADEM